MPKPGRYVWRLPEWDEKHGKYLFCGSTTGRTKAGLPVERQYTLTHDKQQHTWHGGAAVFQYYFIHPVIYVSGARLTKRRSGTNHAADDSCRVSASVPRFCAYTESGSAGCVLLLCRCHQPHSDSSTAKQDFILVFNAWRWTFGGNGAKMNK